MTITITGSKYGQQTIAAVGTTTVQIGAGVFVAGDFAVPRRVDLFTAGGVLKGHAFVRKFQSATTVQLEDLFRNWKTGIAATQAVGDLILVSKNWAESVGGAITVVGDVVSIGDDLLFGTNGAPMSLALHDEGKNFLFTLTGTFQKQMGHQGGVVSFGHLQDWVSRSFYSPCNFSSPAPAYPSGLWFTSTAAYFYQFGGNYNIPSYYTSGFNGAPFGSDAGFFWALKVAFFKTDILSPNAGGNWVDGTNHVIEDCSFVDGQNALMVRFANGIVLGGLYKILDAAFIYGVFGSDAGGTYPIGAPAGKRSVVVDIGPGPLWRSSGAVTQAVNSTNLISTNYGMQSDGGPNNNATNTVAFQDTYSNLVPGTTGVIVRNDTLAAVQSVVGSSASWSPIVEYNKIVGYTQQPGYPIGPWSFGLKAYGYAPQGGAIAATPYSLGSAGTAQNVAFGGFVRQLADAGVTRAIGAIPATLLTLDDLYDAMHAWSVLTVANAQIPTVSTLPITFSGTLLDLAGYNLTVNSAAVTNFSITGNTITIKSTALASGTKFTQFKTTGTVTTASATVAAPFTDSTGNSFLQFDSIDTWQVYSNPARTALSASGTGAQLYKFNFVAVTTYYLVLVVSGEEFRKQVTPTATGATLVSLSSTALLTVLQAKVLDAPATASAVWNAVKANYAIAGSTGAALGTGGGGGTGATLAEIEGSNVIARQATATATLAAVQALPTAPTAAQIWTNATRTLTASIDPTAAQVATAVRTELGTELARVDAAVSTRLATAGYTAPNNTGVASTLAAVQALPQAPAASVVASAVRTAISTELALIDAPVSTRLAATAYTAPNNTGITNTLAAVNALPLAPSGAVIATAVRAELTTELGRVDAPITSRLPTAGYTAPNNAGIASISGAVAALPVPPTAAVISDAVLVKVDASTALAKQATVLAAAGAALTPAQVTTAVMDAAVEGALTTKQAMRVLLAPVMGKTAGAGTNTETFMAQDGVTPRVTTTFDGTGNRTSVTINPA